MLISQQYQHSRGIINDIFKELHQLTVSIGNKKMSETVDEIRSRLNEPFLFVIVGEVKVGKSSFVNALLETNKEVCKVAPDPCTDTIQQIVYDETEKVISINPYLKKITLPVNILKDIAIVDTPGTNTVMEHHTEITEKFIPVSDLIIFVFEAKNPYRQSAWKFLDYVSKEWRKKVIFVLQQSDLIDPDDLEINKKGVIEYAIKRGISKPQVFCVSAKQELDGETDISGFKDIREYINATVTGGNNVRLKVQSLFNTSKNIIGSIETGIEERKNQMEIDNEFRLKVNGLLDSSDQKTSRQIDELIEELLAEYDKITGQIKEELEEGLGVFTLIKKSFASVFGSSQSVKEWIEELTKKMELNLKPALENKLKDGVINIADSIRQMAEIIDIEIRKNKEISSNSQIFGDIANKRQEKLDKLQLHITEFIDETEDFMNNEMQDKSSTLTPNLALGGSLAVIGVILMSIAHTVVIDVTGGILSALGFSIAGIYTAIKKGQIVREFEAEIAKGRKNLKEQVYEKLHAYVKEIRTKIDNNFLEFDAFLNKEELKMQDLVTQYKSIDDKFSKLAKDLDIAEED